MTDLPTDLTERLRELDAKATPGPWAAGSEKSSYDRQGWAVLLDADGKSIGDTLNASNVEIREEHSDGSATYWDEIGDRNFALIVALRNALPEIDSSLEELSRLKAGEGEAERGRLECVTAILHALDIEDDAELRQFLKDWSEGDYTLDYIDRLAAALPPAPGGRSDG